MDGINENSIILEIESEYKRINKNWMRLHYNTFVGLVLFGSTVECMLGMTLFAIGYVEIPLIKYIIKYMAAPLLFNLIFILTGVWAMHSPRFRQPVKLYFISLLFVGVCFVFYSVHSIFNSLYLIFTLPILLTVIYGDYILTTVTALFSIAAKTVSEVFVNWDPDKIHPFDSTVCLTDFSISICILLAFYIACIVVIRFEREKNTASIQKEVERYQMQQKLITDKLTKIYNRTALRSAFQNMEADAAQTAYLFVMIDLDNFKQLNDTLGHDEGDEYLKEFGRILKRNCQDAIPFRFGGDEFCILFKNKTMNETLNICRRIQSDLKESAVCQTSISQTASIGVARYQRPMSSTQLLRNTDAALYQAKEAKNCISIFEEDCTAASAQGYPDFVAAAGVTQGATHV